MNDGEFDYVCVHIAAYSGPLNRVLLHGLCKMLTLIGNSTHQGGAAEHFTGSIAADIEPNRLREFLEALPGVFVQVYHPNCARPAPVLGPTAGQIQVAVMYKAQRMIALDTPLNRLELNPRSKSALMGLGVAYLGQVVQKTEHELLAIRGLDHAVLAELQRVLAQHHLRLDMSAEDLMGWLPPNHLERPVIM